MNKEYLQSLLTEVASGGLTPEEATERLKSLPYDDIGIAKPDMHRELRTGRAEVIYGLSKTPRQTAEIMKHISERTSPVMATKVSEETFAFAAELLGEGRLVSRATFGEPEYIPLAEAVTSSGDGARRLTYFTDAKLLVASGPAAPVPGEPGSGDRGADQAEETASAAKCGVAGEPASPESETEGGGTGGRAKHSPAGGEVAVLCAGTADIPIAEEAAVTAALYGAKLVRHYDVGVAGIHRLLSKRDAIASADALVVVAGMEGALPSVVGGLASVPVIAVPTSVGYGVSMGGLTALFAMLSSCALGVSVVNIDNGFGAGYLASLIANAGKQPL